jgi:hypothetical protein
MSCHLLRAASAAIEVSREINNVAVEASFRGRSDMVRERTELCSVWE